VVDSVPVVEPVETWISTNSITGALELNRRPYGYAFWSPVRAMASA
jgi:hypothetical protein